MVIRHGTELSQSPLSCHPPMCLSGTGWFRFSFFLFIWWTEIIFYCIKMDFLYSFIHSLNKHLLTNPISQALYKQSIQLSQVTCDWLNMTFRHTWPSSDKHSLHIQRCTIYMKILNYRDNYLHAEFHTFTRAQAVSIIYLITTSIEYGKDCFSRLWVQNIN